MITSGMAPRSLFAALNVLEGWIIGRCMQRHRHQEFIRFLNTIEADIPAGKIIHVVLENYATHKHAKRCYGASGAEKASSSLQTNRRGAPCRSRMT
jgi:hypothetical protein